jgi:hypothetical protein
MSNIKEVQVVRNNQTVTTPIGADAENVDISYNSSGVAVDSDDESVASTSDLKTFINSTNTNLGGKAPTNHAANTTAYGGGTNANFGHVKLTDSYTTVDQNAKAANSVGASAYALQEFYDEFKSSHLGHIIQDDTTTYTDRTNLKFENAKITDDATNDATIITPEYVEMTQAEYDALTPEEKNDGTLRFITDSGVAEPADVAIRKDSISGNVSTSLTLADNNMTFENNKPVFGELRLKTSFNPVSQQILYYTYYEPGQPGVRPKLVMRGGPGSGGTILTNQTIRNEHNLTIGDSVFMDSDQPGESTITVKANDVIIQNDYTHDSETDTDTVNEITFPKKSGEVSLKEELLDLIYPVGSIYITVGDINPSTTLGGTWVQFGAGKVLVGLDTSDTDFNLKSKTGGAKTSSYTPAGKNTNGAVKSHTLTINEIPSHQHLVYAAFASGWRVAGQSADNNLKAGVSGQTAKASTDQYTYAAGGGGGHTHGFTQPTFTGTAANIPVVQPYITVAMWERTA